MKYLWKLIDGKDLRKKQKHRLFLFLNILVFFLLSLCFGLLAGKLFQLPIEWILCIVGYVTCGIGYVGGIFFLYKVS